MLFQETRRHRKTGRRRIKTRHAQEPILLAHWRFLPPTLASVIPAPSSHGPSSWGRSGKTLGGCPLQLTVPKRGESRGAVRSTCPRSGCGWARPRCLSVRCLPTSWQACSSGGMASLLFEANPSCFPWDLLCPQSSLVPAGAPAGPSISAHGSHIEESSNPSSAVYLLGDLG